MRNTLNESQAAVRSKFFYGWVIVVSCTLMMAIAYGLMYSYSVFFKPLAEYFNWDRATVSLIYSASLILRGAVSIGTGYLADRFGALKISAGCGILIGLGLVFSSQVQNLWQFFITYAVIEAIGLSGTFGIATTVTTRWFTRNRGLALGIVSSGVGIGTVLVVPGTERLISTLDWSAAFMITGIAAGSLIVIGSFFLRPAPKPSPAVDLMEKKEQRSPARQRKTPAVPQPDLTLGEAVRSPRMLLLLTVNIALFFCTQLVIVHLVNYATDMGITPLVAATFVSLVGGASIFGRLVMGAGADRIGMHNTMILCCVLLVLAFILLFFTRELWEFYLFAVLFGFAYGGEVPLIPLFVNKFGGIRSMTTLMGLALFVGSIGGALGPWVAGKIFDVTSNYQWAFIVGAAVAAASLMLALVLKRQAQGR